MKRVHLIFFLKPIQYTIQYVFIDNQYCIKNLKYSKSKIFTNYITFSVRHNIILYLLEYIYDLNIKVHN